MTCTYCLKTASKYRPRRFIPIRTVPFFMGNVRAATPPLFGEKSNRFAIGVSLIVHGILALIFVRLLPGNDRIAVISKRQAHPFEIRKHVISRKRELFALILPHVRTGELGKRTHLRNVSFTARKYKTAQKKNRKNRPSQISLPVISFSHDKSICILTAFMLQC